ncbi:hypothetical protein GGX14DRAFT_567918 [Mycena pura]|uniref:Uncharacterized protein n=1 Tax=Mycena pura TaxID=153505 RepID=A0AAD6V9L8_9AGAR|nr:hypothetical protein GGX14DRAFT_567918 [Mycena pura]
MSARQPFIPGQGFGGPSRPESRIAISNSNLADTTSTALHFVPDPSNPLNGGPVHKAQKDRTNDANSETSLLNLGSLTKNTRSQNPRRSSVQISRSATSDPHAAPASAPLTRPATSDPNAKPKPLAPNHRLQAHANAHSIVSPTPLLARSNTSLFSNSPSFSSYKSPALPANHASPRQPDAHQDFANDNDSSYPQPSTEQPPDDEARSEHSAMRFVTLPSQPGPHRIVFGAHDSDDLYGIAEPAPRKATGKRKRAEVDEDADDAHTRTQGFGGPAKRFKAQQQPQPDERAYPRDGEGYHAQPRSSSPHDATGYAPGLQAQVGHMPDERAYPRDGEVYRPPPRSSSLHEAAGYPPGLPAQAGHTGDGAGAAYARYSSQYHDAGPDGAQAPAPHDAGVARLLDLLKVDNDAIDVDAKVDKYMRSAERWRSCSREEWIAGADEIAAMYTKIFDFAKAHMACVVLLPLPCAFFSLVLTGHDTSEKAKLFAQCEGRLQDHGRVLAERDGLLVGVKQRLVEESGDVLSK